MKIKKIYEPVFRTHLLFLYDCSYIEAESYLSENDIRTDLMKCSGQTGVYEVKKPDKSVQKRYYIYIANTKDGVLEDLSTLLHEITHLIFLSLADCEIKITNQTDEIFSYYFEWWFKRLIKLPIIKEFKKNKKI
jgi:hypothetical protein